MVYNCSNNGIAAIDNVSSSLVEVVVYRLSENEKMYPCR